MASTKPTTRLMTREEYDAKVLELEGLPPSSSVRDSQQVLWTKGWDSMWTSTDVMRRNSAALVTLLNSVEVGAGGSNLLL